MIARENLNDLVAFIAVARAKSFTKAAAQMGLSQSSLSHTVRGFEERLGVRLFTRTTRSVSPTEAGERLLATVAPRFEEIEAELGALADLDDKPAGNIRITASDYSATTLVWPKLKPLLLQYPDLKLEISMDYGLRDIVAERYDAGIRFGDQLEKDMIAVRISPDMRMAIVGAPGYLSKRGIPVTPQDLGNHSCINLRLPTRGSLLPWELRNEGRELQVRVEGQLIFDSVFQMRDGALSGFGLAYVPDQMVEQHVANGELQYVLENWFPTFTGYHLYYPNRRQTSRALAIVIEALRYRSRGLTEAT